MQVYLKRQSGSGICALLYPAKDTFQIEVIAFKVQYFEIYTIRFGRIAYNTNAYVWDYNLRPLLLNFEQIPGLFYLHDDFIVDGMQYPCKGLRLVNNALENCTHEAFMKLSIETIDFYKAGGFI